MRQLIRALLCLMLQTYISRALCSGDTEYLNSDELAQLTNLLQDIQLNDKDNIIKQQHLDGNQLLLNQLSEYISTETGTVSNGGNIESPSAIGGIENVIKSKRGWEDIQRPWRGYFPKRAWDVVRSYWRLPAFRIAYRNYIGKRSNEQLVEVPVQPGNDHVPTMYNDLGYKDIGDSKVVPESDTEENSAGSQELDDSWNNKDRQEKRGDLEATSEFPNDRILKRGWEDIRLPQVYSPLKRGWGELMPFSSKQFGKRGWEDVRLSSYRTIGKRGWEDMRLFGNGQFGKRGWEDVRFNTPQQFGKRGWEDLRLFQNGQFGKRGWEDVRFNTPQQLGKRGWEDLRLFQNGQFGKRGWEDVRFNTPQQLGKRGWEDLRLFQNGQFGKRGWEDVRFNTPRPLGKRGWEDLRLFQNGQFGKRGWEDVRFNTPRPLGKRGWEDLRLFQNGKFGKRGWEDLRLFRNTNVGKRGWEDVRLYPGRQVGKRDDVPLYYGGTDRNGNKRGWEDIRLPQSGQYGKRSKADTQFYGDQVEKRGWEDVRPYDFNRIGKRGWEDIRLFQGCGCCNSAYSYRHCCFSCRASFRKRSIENEHTNSDRSHVVHILK